MEFAAFLLSFPSYASLVRLELLVVTFLGFTPTAVICDMRGT
jgi:hypothetical protein